MLWSGVIAVVAAADAGTRVASGGTSGVVVFALLTFAALAAFTARRWRERWLAWEQQREAVALREQQLGMVLTASGCELWRVDLDHKLLYRISYIPGTGLTRQPQGEPASVFLSLVHPDDRAELRAAFDAHVEGRQREFAAVYRVRAPGGKYLWLSSRGHRDPMPKARRGSRLASGTVSGTTIDVTAMKTSQLHLSGLNHALEQQLSELRMARAEIEAIEAQRKLALWGSGCEFFDADLAADEVRRENQLEALAANKVGARLSGYWEYLHPDDIAVFNAGFVAHVKGKSAFFDVTYRTRRTDGRWAWVQTRGRIVARDAHERAIRIAGTNYDVSQLKIKELQLQGLADELEHRVAARTEELSRALNELQTTQSQLVESEKMAALGALVAGVSHEINTPLGVSVTAASHLSTISKTFLKQIEQGTLSKRALNDYAEAATQSADLVLKNLTRANELIRSFKQVAVDQSSEQRRAIELKGYLQDILSSLQPTLKRARHDVVLDCPEPLEIDTFPGALYQIISNLLINACVHAFPNEHSGCIRLLVRANANELSMAISDNGVGMSPEVRSRVFEPFFTTRRGQGGSGLGLHIVYNLVTQVLGGRIDVESTLGQGTCFTLRLPGAVTLA